MSAAKATILICRHGQDEDNAAKILNGHRNEPLTALGREQAATAAQHVAATFPGIDVILASPLQRAFVTAEAIGAAVGVAPERHDELIERDFGALSGQPLADIPKFATQFLQTDKVNYFLDGEGVESFDDCMARAQRVVAAVDARHAGKTVLLVCHGDIMKMLLGVRRDVDWRTALQEPYIDNTQVLKL
jgi:probable phosphoglycerate mutase